MAATSRTRDEMRQMIDRGESVFVRTEAGGVRIVSRHEDLPSEAEIARVSGDAADVAEARKALEARKRAIDVELAALDSPTPPPEGPKAPEPARLAAPSSSAPPAPAVKAEPPKAPEKK